MVSYALSQHVTPLLPLSGGTLRDNTKNGSLSYAEAKISNYWKQASADGKRERRSSLARFLFSLSPASPLHKKGFGCGGEREWLATKNGLPSGSLAFFHASTVDQRPFLWRAAGYFGLGTWEKLLALRASRNSFNFHHFECLVLYAAVYPGVYCLGAQRFTPSEGELHDVTIERF